MRSLRKIVAQLGAVILVTAGALAVASPARAAGFYNLVNHHSGRCLAIGGSSLEDGTQAIQWTCSINFDQVWHTELVDGATATWTIQNIQTLQCLSIAPWSPGNGAPVVQLPCRYPSTPEQQWVRDSWARLRNKATDRCLAIPNGSLLNGMGAIQWSCNTNLDQRWRWTS